MCERTAGDRTAHAFPVPPAEAYEASTSQRSKGTAAGMLLPMSWVRQNREEPQGAPGRPCPSVGAWRGWRGRHREARGQANHLAGCAAACCARICAACLGRTHTRDGHPKQDNASRVSALYLADAKGAIPVWCIEGIKAKACGHEGVVANPDIIALWDVFGAHKGVCWASIARRQCLADVDGHGSLGGIVKHETSAPGPGQDALLIAVRSSTAPSESRPACERAHHK